MKYVFLNYFQDGSLTNFAIIFGKYNLEFVETKNKLSLYKSVIDDKEFYFPLRTDNINLVLGDEKNIFDVFPFLNNFKKIILLPSNENSGHEIIKEYRNEKLFTLMFQGDPVHSEYDDNIFKISCVESKNLKGNCFFDLKLCIPYFFYRHQLSLIDYDFIDNLRIEKPQDKIFFYQRRIFDVSYTRDRAYFVKKLLEIIPKEKTDTIDILHKNIELNRISIGLYHLGNYIDYRKNIFNIIFESQHVDFHKINGKEQTWISEKSLFAILLANPFFLLANDTILKELKNLGIYLLNDEFPTDDIENSFNKFCYYFQKENLDEKMKLFEKHRLIQIENRKKILNYIYSPKKDVINFIIKQYE